MPAFDRYIGIDYSGAETPTASLKGLRVYLADGSASRRRCRRRRRHANTGRGAASPNGWLSGWPRMRPTLVGIDHGFSFPLRYFESHGLKPDWPAFLDDFQRHWPTDEDTSMSISSATAR